MRVLLRLNAWLLIPAVVWAASAPEVTTPGSAGFAGALLAQPLGARGRALGSAFAGAASDSSAIWWNPGGLHQITAFDTEVIMNKVTDSANVMLWSGAIPAGPGVVGAAVYYFDLGQYEERNAEGVPGALVAISELGVLGSWAMKNPEWIPFEGGWGATVGASRDVLGTWTPSLSIGDQVSMRRNWTAGVALRNLGAPQDGALPQMAIAAGAAWRPVKSVTGLAELKYGIGDRLYRAGIGAEWNPFGGMSLRTGFKLLPDNAGLAALSSPTAGFGLRWKRLGFNYVYEPMGDLGTMSILSLSWGVFHR